jgi:hypothetical protein
VSSNHCFFCFVCLRLVSCVPDVASFSGLFICNCPSEISKECSDVRVVLLHVIVCCSVLGCKFRVPVLFWDVSSDFCFITCYRLLFCFGM